MCWFELFLVMLLIHQKRVSARVKTTNFLLALGWKILILGSACIGDPTKYQEGGRRGLKGQYQ